MREQEPVRYKAPTDEVLNIVKFGNMETQPASP